MFFALGVLMSALLNIGMGFSTVLTVSIALWALNGWFQGFGAPAGVVAMTDWFSNSERGRFYGIWSTAHSMGEGLTFFVRRRVRRHVRLARGLLGAGHRLHRSWQSVSTS